MQLNALAMATAAVLAVGDAPLHGQTWPMPPDNQRCPSKWGADRPARFRQHDEAARMSAARQN